MSKLDTHDNKITIGHKNSFFSNFFVFASHAERARCPRGVARSDLFGFFVCYLKNKNEKIENEKTK
jgi:hypothetical protein